MRTSPLSLPSRPVTILGSGHALPDRIVTSIALDHDLGLAAGSVEALRYASPTVAWLFLLMNRTEMSFGEYQKEFFKWSLPMFGIFIVTAIVTGELPVG